LTTINEFPVPTPNGQPSKLTAGPDGNVWFTESAGNAIGRVTPAGVVTEFPVPTPSSYPEGITTGPDGNLWFVEEGPTSGLVHSKIGRITPSGVITEFTIGTFPSSPTSIAAGSDGNLWFTEFDANSIGRITPSGIITDFPIPVFDTEPASIVAGPDGNLWFTENNGMNIGRITTGGFITQFPYTDFTEDIAAGPDGNLWFTDAIDHRIGRITTTGVVTPVPLPPLGVLRGICTGPDGNLWVANRSSNAIDQITPAGIATSFPVLTATSNPTGVASGPDGNIWFTEFTSGKIGRLAVDHDLSLMGTAPASVTMGQNVTYTLTVNSVGAAGATGVTLTDTLPTGVTFVSATGGVTPVGGVLTFALGSLAVGGSATVTIVVTPTATGALNNQANVSGNETDPTPADNTVTQMTTVTPAAMADLSVSGSAPASVTVGQQVTYTLHVHDSGPSGATGVTLRDTLPSPVRFISATGGVTPAGGVLTFHLGNLANGANSSVTIIVIPSAAGTLNNRADVSGNENDPNPVNNSSTAATLVAGPNPLDADLDVGVRFLKQDLGSPGTAAPGDLAAFQLFLVNVGPGAARSVSLTDAVPAGTTFVSFTTNSPGWTIHAPAVGGTGTITATAAALAPGGNAETIFLLYVQVNPTTPDGTPISDTARATAATTDPNPANNATTDGFRVVGPNPLDLDADLEVGVRFQQQVPGPPETIAPGELALFQLFLVDVGPGAARSVSLTDAVPAGTTFVSFATNSPGWTIHAPAVGGTGTITATAAALAPGGNAETIFLLYVQVNPTTPEGTPISDTARATAATTDPNPANNASTDGFRVLSRGADLEVFTIPPPITLGGIAPGADAVFKLHLHNIGPAVARSVALADAVPAGTTFVSFTAPSGWAVHYIRSGRRAAGGRVGPITSVTATAAALAPGANAVFRLVVRVNSATPDGTLISDTAQATAATSDPNPANNTSTTSFAVMAAPTNVAPSFQTRLDGSTTLTINWSHPSVIGGPVTFNVYRSTTPGSEGLVPLYRNVVQHAQPDTSVVPGSTYYYQVSAVAGGIESPRSVEVKVNVPALPGPPSPTDVRSASVALGPQGEVLEMVARDGTLTQFDLFGPHRLSVGVRSASVAIGPRGRVLEVVTQDGTLTQLDLNGAHNVRGGVLSAATAFGPFGEVLDVVSRDGTLTQYDTFGAHRLLSGVRSTSVAFGPGGGEVHEVVFRNGTLTQLDAAGVHVLGSGVLSASMAFYAGSQVFVVVYQNGNVIQYDAFGTHLLDVLA
jgi:uncharacterized repeat protein (TIGR01451 family)